MLKGFFSRLASERKGGTAIEYGLIAAVIVLSMIGAFMQLADTTVGMWGNINTKMETARSGQ